MILDNTPYGLVMKVLSDEADKVLFFRNKELRKAAKDFSRCTVDGLSIHWTYYTVPSSRNKYLVWFIYENNGSLDNSAVRSGQLLVVTSSNGDRTFYKRRKNSPQKDNGIGEQHFSLCVYTSHFFRRYRERMGFSHKETTENIIIRFFYQNNWYGYELPMEKMNLHASEYQNGISYELSQGVAFLTRTTEELTGVVPAFECLKYNTFVPYDTLKDGQREVTAKHSVVPVVQETLRKRMFIASHGIMPFKTADKKELPADGNYPTLDEVMRVNMLNGNY